MKDFPKDYIHQKNSYSSNSSELIELEVEATVYSSTKLHNPDSLTYREYGGVNGYRLLNEDEVLGAFPRVRLAEIERHQNGHWVASSAGHFPDCTYRTKLSRKKLASRRRAY